MSEVSLNMLIISIILGGVITIADEIFIGIACREDESSEIKEEVDCDKIDRTVQ